MGKSDKKNICEVKFGPQNMYKISYVILTCAQTLYCLSRRGLIDV